MAEQLKDIPSEGKGRITKDEVEKARLKTHDLDIQKDIDRFKKIFNKNRKYKKGEVRERANKISISKISDGWMVKYEIEGFINNTSIGTRILKFYVSDTVKDGIMDILNEFPKMSQDNSRFPGNPSKRLELPKIVEKEELKTEKLLDIDDLWDVSIIEDKEEEDMDVWTL